MPIKAIIVDDEINMRALLKMKLAKYCPNIDIIGEAENTDDALSMIKTHQPDVVFLDISMPGKSGLTILDTYAEMPFELVFVSGFNKEDIHFPSNTTCDYLSKPISNMELINIVENIQSRIALKNAS